MGALVPALSPWPGGGHVTPKCLACNNRYLSGVSVGLMLTHVPTLSPVPVSAHVPAPDLPADLAAQVDSLRLAGKAPATIRAYRSDLRRFVAWCDQAGLQSLPAHPDTVSAYLADQVGQVKVSTLRRHLATISKAHQVAGLPNPCKTTALADTLAGIRRTHGCPPDQAPGLLADQVRTVLGALPADLAGVRDRALLLAGWCAGLRRSEIAALTWADLADDPAGLVLTLRRSKTDQTGAGRLVGLAAESDPKVCPVTALESWRNALQQAGGSVSGNAPVFVQINRHAQVRPGGLSGHAVAEIVQRRTAQAGLSARYRGHSLRKGLVQSARLAGVQDSAVMATTGHKTVTMLRLYQGQVGLVSNAAAKGLLS